MPLVPPVPPPAFVPFPVLCVGLPLLPPAAPVPAPVLGADGVEVAPLELEYELPPPGDEPPAPDDDPPPEYELGGGWLAWGGG